MKNNQCFHFDLECFSNKSATDAVSGDPTNAGGETDIQATFTVTVE
ncbi:hypothetical protein [Marivirga arenosa]|uniref:Uncharacterized protein n=1 Tax=Marivirga arenosa TaxID=3059076 RepID=A0AA49GF17_9BACT|nr:hypothetical protein [Marivirga sp. BKB1-2]WKK78752.2 hypothetical protein QYS47_14270 [Marivirga sp. BKB1-2]